MEEPKDLTETIDRALEGDGGAIDTLFTIAYEELRRLARVRLRGSPRDTLLNTTSLVHESYLRLAAAGRLRTQDRLHFMGYASRAMRSVIVDIVRKRLAEKHGGSAVRVVFTDQIAELAVAGEREILRIDDALKDLAECDARLAQVVEMRYFGGMTESETAEALGITERTVRRDWRKARLLLSQAL